MSTYSVEQHEKTHTFVLIGPDCRCTEYMRVRGLAPDDAFVVPVESVKELRAAMDRRGQVQVLFLEGWMTLAEWRPLYNACIANGWAQPWNHRGSS